MINIGFYVSGTACAEKGKIENITLPLFQNGYDIQKGYLKNLNTKYLNYKLDEAFPANKVISFYSEYFTNSGFIPYSEDGYGKSKWESFNFKSGTWESTNVPPARYIVSER